LVIFCPLTDQTRCLVNREVLQALGPEGYLINVARGPVVDESALIEALQQNKIAGAGLDVFWDEPRVPNALMELDNVVMVPHIGSNTKQIRLERGRKVLLNLQAHFEGQPVPFLVV
ncbi:MAG: NAD(P)-dependent oxidoreductase, partial [Betaproteobacteria bacterium]